MNVAPPKWCGAPIGHAAAGIVAERTPTRPVDGEAAAATLRVVRGPGSRAEPHIPVDLLTHLFGRQVAKLRQRIDVDVDRFDAAELAGPGRIDIFAIVAEHALAAAGKHAAITPGRGNHPRAFTQRERFRLLAVHVLAAAAGLDGNDRMPMVGRGNVHRVDVGASQQFAEIVVDLAVAVLIVTIDVGLGLLAHFFANIAQGHVLHVFAIQKGALIAAALIADADAGHHNPIAGRRTAVLAQRGRGNDIGGGHRRAGGLKKSRRVGFRKLLMSMTPCGLLRERDAMASSQAPNPNSDILASRRG